MDLRWMAVTRLRRRRPLWTSSIVEECSAYLAGDYEALLRRRHAPVPPWATLNRLAHGSLAQVRSLSRPSRFPRWWRRPDRLTGGLATRILQLVEDDPERLVALQQAVLIPLELQLASREQPTPGTGEVIARTLVALRTARP